MSGFEIITITFSFVVGLVMAQVLRSVALCRPGLKRSINSGWVWSDVGALDDKQVPGSAAVWPDQRFSICAFSRSQRHRRI